MLVKNILFYGGKGDGKTVNTKAIDKAIDDISSQGGGKLVFSEGTFLTGGFYLKSNIEIHLEKGAVLRSTGNLEDYYPDEKVFGTFFENEECMGGTLIYGENIENVKFSGEGAIDGNGIKITAGEEAYKYPEGVNHYGEDDYKFINTIRPFTLRIADGKNIEIDGVTFRNPASWNIGMIRCDNVKVTNTRFYSKNFYNGDGLDFNACENVFVSNCDFDCTDDCIALQSSFEGRSCKNIHINDCKFTGILGGVRIGMTNIGTHEDVFIENCSFENIGCSALKFQNCEGGDIKNVFVNNCTFKNCTAPIFFTNNVFPITLKKFATIPAHEGFLGNIEISNVKIINEKPDKLGGIIMDGAKGCGIENIVIKNSEYSYVQENTPVAGKDIPTLDGKRPERDKYLPDGINAGFLLRNCKNVDLSSLKVTEANDLTPAAVLIDCENVSMPSNVKTID